MIRVILLAGFLTIFVFQANAKTDEEIFLDDLENVPDDIETPEVDPCVTTCFGSKPDPELEMFFGNLGHPMQIKYIHKILVPHLLGKYCGHVNESFICLAKCKPSRMKEIFSRAFAPLSYMCLESNFLDYAPCYKQIYDQLESQCCNNESACGVLRQKAVDILQGREERLQNETSQLYMQRMIRNICQYANCANRCRRPKITEKCGHEANVVLNSWYSKMVEALGESQVFLGFNVKVPAECNVVGKL